MRSKRKSAKSFRRAATTQANAPSRNGANGAACARPVLVSLPVDSILPNPSQPRGTFDEKLLKALGDSLRERGMLQPVMVRRLPGQAKSGASSKPAPETAGEHGANAQGGGNSDAGSGVLYELVAGERRLLAARLADFAKIPAIIREVSDDDMLVLALIENQHRQNLNPIEKAQAYQVLHANQPDKRGLSHEEIGALTGEDCKTVGNTIRLLNLGKTARDFVKSGALSAEHGKLLLGVRDLAAQSKLARTAVKKDWSVRRLAGRIREGKRDGSAQSHADSTEANELQALMSQKLKVNAKVKFQVRTRGRGMSILCDHPDEMTLVKQWMRTALKGVK